MSQTVIGPYDDRPAACLDYDPAFPVVAERIAALIRGELPGTVVEHVGSTAAEGCPGKGVIDLVVAYPEGALAAVRDGLDRLGFQRQGSGHAFPESRPMRRGSLEHGGRSYRIHAHVIQQGAAEIEELLRFRDLLRGDPALRAEYVAHKQRILAAGVTDTNAYSVAKGPFIDAVLAGEGPVP